MFKLFQSSRSEANKRSEYEQFDDDSANDGIILREFFFKDIIK